MAKTIPVVSALMVSLTLQACAMDKYADEPRYSAGQLAAGVAIEAHDRDDVIESAVVFLPPAGLADALGLVRDGIVVQQPRDEFDAVVVYSTGPYCGILPDVEIGKGDNKIRVWVTERHDDSCDDMEYHEAIGLDLRSQYETLQVTGHWG